MILMAVPVLAQQPASADDSGEVVTLLENIKKAGIPGLLIILLSVAGVSLIITFAMQVRRDAMVPPDLLGHIEGLFEEEDYDAALEVVESNPSFLSTVLADLVGTGFAPVRKYPRTGAKVQAARSSHVSSNSMTVFHMVAPRGSA